MNFAVMSTVLPIFVSNCRLSFEFSCYALRGPSTLLVASAINAKVMGKLVNVIMLRNTKNFRRVGRGVAMQTTAAPNVMIPKTIRTVLIGCHNGRGATAVAGSAADDNVSSSGRTNEWVAARGFRRRVRAMRDPS